MVLPKMRVTDFWIYLEIVLGLKGGHEVNQMQVDEMYRNAVQRLKDSSIWLNHETVKTWLVSTWLCIPEVSTYVKIN